MLSYERLLVRLHTLTAITDQTFSGEEYEERRCRIQLAIKSAIISSSQAGLDGDQEVLSPGQLKHWLEKKIKDIHKSFDDPVQEEQATSPGKRRLATSTTPVAASNKRQKRQATEEQNAAAALVALARPVTPAFTHDIIAARRIARGRKAYTHFPTVDRSRGLKDTFLAGVQYALQNLAAASATEPSAPAFNCVEFHDYVRAELGIKTALEREVEKRQAEGGAAGDVEATWAAGQLTGMANAGCVGARDIGASGDAGQAGSKGFWDVI